MNLLEKWQLAANVATTCGLAGVAFAYFEFREGAKAQRRTTAVVAWNEYLRLALAHPNLARPAVWLTGQGRETAQYGEYRWFVAAMFFACEQVLEAYAEDGAWESVVRSQIRYHEGFLELPEFDANVYSAVLARICREVRSETKARLTSHLPSTR
jgi:hypothetical protein